MSKLSKFIKDYQHILTSIALFGALATFFLDFLKDKDDLFISQLLPLSLLLIVVFLLFYTYYLLEKIKETDKPLKIFKLLTILILSFIVFFIFEYWANLKVLIGKVFIAIIILLAYLYISKMFIEKKWILNKLFLPFLLLFYIVVTLSIILVLVAKDCVNDESYQYFILLFSLFLLTLFMIFTIVYVYNNIFDSLMKLDKSKAVLILVISAIILIIGFVLNKYVKNFSLLQCLSDFLVFIINLPKNFFC